MVITDFARNLNFEQPKTSMCRPSHYGSDVYGQTNLFVKGGITNDNHACELLEFTRND